MRVNSNKGENSVDPTQILQPLVSTTTTTKSASSAGYAVVPSVDGTIYITSNDMTVSTSMKELVARSPFLDPRGRFHVSSRYDTAAALDVETGEILRVVSAEGYKGGSGNKGNSHDKDAPSLKGRNVVWIGRVDHLVSVQDARTGHMDAQFSVAEVMSVGDMNGMTRREAWTPTSLQAGYSRRNSGKLGARIGLPGSDEEPLDPFILPSAELPSVVNGDAEISSTLVATPNGNIAFYDHRVDTLSWVADQSFKSPIAFAMDAATGLPIRVDIIPDAVDPNGEGEYLRREMERQLTAATHDDVSDEQTIVGAMPNGQLYALPLGLKSAMTAGSRATASTIVSSTSSIAAAASSNAGNTKYTTQVSQLPGRPNSNFHDNRQQQQRSEIVKTPQYADLHSQGKLGLLAGKKSCVPTSSTFPACLVPQRADQNNRYEVSSDVGPQLGNAAYVWPHGKYQSEDANVEGGLAVTTSQFHEHDGGFYHPDFGYVSPQDFYLFQQRAQSKYYKKMFWLLGSWLPPTILCIFVVSFELGRRKRLKDERQRQQDALVKVEQTFDKKRALISSIDGLDSSVEVENQIHQPHIISVSDEVLGYGGHGTVVYKGMLDGRDVAVKRMLKAYHASADREISLLIESDGDPNVVRYFLKEVRGDFVYLALELCDMSLHDLIGVLRENQQKQPTIGLEVLTGDHGGSDSAVVSSTRRILLQIASGVKHLHSLRIVHRYQ
jgi:hypothetical protein